MSTTMWVGDKMYPVDDAVRDYVDGLEVKLDKANEENNRLQQEIEKGAAQIDALFRRIHELEKRIREFERRR